MAEEITLPKSFEKTMEKVAAAAKKPNEGKAKHNSIHFLTGFRI